MKSNIQSHLDWVLGNHLSAKNANFNAPVIITKTYPFDFAEAKKVAQTNKRLPLHSVGLFEPPITK